MDRGKKMKLIREGAQELIKHIEKLAGPTWIDVSRLHTPIRKALHIVDGEGSGWGARIPFQVYQSAIEKVLRDQAEIQEMDSGLGVPENDNSASDIQKLVDSGMSLEDAISTAAGGDNLSMLAEGALKGFVDMIQKLIPALPLPEGFTDPGEAAGEFLKQGLLEQAPDSPILDRLSPGWRFLQSKMEEGSHLKVIQYARAYAVKNAGTDPAKLWEMWAMYPHLKGIEAGASRYESVAADMNGVEVDPLSDSLFAGSSSNWFSYVRQAGVLLSNVMSTAAACCFFGTALDLSDLKEFISKARTIMSTVKSFNLSDMQLNELNVNNLSRQAQQQIAGAVMASLDANFKKQVDFLRKVFQKIEDKLGSNQCIPIDDLFDGLIGILKDVKNRFASKLRSLIEWEDVTWQSNLRSQQLMMENTVFSRYERLLDQVESLISFENRCQVDQGSIARRAADIIKRSRNEDTGLNVHIDGTPRPAGLDPESPLANLRPINTIHGLEVGPGIQGLDLPTGELEELFQQCRRGTVAESQVFRQLAGVFRRRNRS